MVVCGALVVPPFSSVYTPQDLANRLVALDFGNGTAYAGLQMLEGAVPRAAIKTCSFDVHPGQALRSTHGGRVCCDRLTGTVDYGGGEGRAAGWSPRRSSTARGWPMSRLDGDVYAAFVRASTAAVQRINADKRRYLHYYTREYAGYPEVEALTPDDFNLGRIQVKAPEPIPEAEARWDWEWMSSWGLLHWCVRCRGADQRVTSAGGARQTLSVG